MFPGLDGLLDRTQAAQQPGSYTEWDMLWLTCAGYDELRHHDAYTDAQPRLHLSPHAHLQIERIEARDINGEELLGRIRCCEDALGSINHEKLSPFHQQEMLQRLDDLELRVRTPAQASQGQLQ